jgi:CRISPR-associated protein Csd1
MLVQALAEYADNYLAEELKDAAWEMKPVPWLLQISRQGTFLNATPRMTTETRCKKQVQVPMQMSVPRSPVARVSGHHPLLGTDFIAYVLGVGPWTLDKTTEREKENKHHEAFVSLIGKAAAETGDAALASCVHFYANSDEVEKACNALCKAKPGTLVALSVGEPLVEREAVQQYWRKHYQAAFAGRMEGADGECMISGKFGPIAPTHEKIKGVSSLGGQAAGVALMSFDKEAFRSYGWEQNRNSPISSDRALAYVLAFNDLLKLDKGRRRDRGGIGFLYWLRNPADIDVLDVLEVADPKQVANLLDFDPAANLDANRFYMVGVSGNGGRLRARYWADLALTEVKKNLKNWHEQLRVEYPWDRPLVNLWHIRYALNRDGKLSGQMELALQRRAIEGLPLGYSMLSEALTCLRNPSTSHNKTKEAQGQKSSDLLEQFRVPIALVRMSLNDLFRKEGEKEMSEGLNPTCPYPAYVCGRLMAAYEDLQYKTAKRAGVPINKTITDRFFSLASTYPAAAFAEIVDLGQKHLKKLRRLDSSAAFGIEKRIMEISNLLQPGEKGPYPSDLSLEGQGLFALGYFHQRSRSISDAIDAKLSKETSNQDSDQENQR